MRQLNLTKIILGLLVLANIVFLGINAKRTFDRLEDDSIENAKKGAKIIKQQQLAFRKDLDQIVGNQIIKIGRASEHFQKKARELGFDTTREVYIPSEPKEKKTSKFLEESWTIEFRGKDMLVDFKRIAQFANEIERSAPGFQIKEIDFGKRVGDYGKDDWKPGSITVRRIERRRAN